MDKKIWLIERDDGESGWEVFTSAVVVAFTEEEAKRIHPSEYKNEPLPTEAEHARYWELMDKQGLSDEEYQQLRALKELFDTYDSGRTWPKHAGLVKATCLGVATGSVESGSVVVARNTGA